MKLHSIAAAATLLLAGPLMAHTIVYNVDLHAVSGAATGSGTAVVTVDYDALTMDVEATFSGLSGNVTASHIHCCSSTPGVIPGGAIVATQTPTFTGFPLGVKAGTYSHIFDMTLASSYNPAFVTLHTDVLGAFGALGQGMDNGTAYLNIHTTTFGGGEIQGFLVAQVPEVGTSLMMGLGLLGVAGWARRRRV